MKTLETIKTAYLGSDNKMSFFQFETNLGFAGNLETVEMMAKNGNDAAIKYLPILKNMSSRQRSESRIYYKLSTQFEQEWVLAKSQLLNELPKQKIKVKYTADISRSSKSRIKTFNIYADIYSYPERTIKISYCKEYMTIKCEIL